MDVCYNNVKNIPLKHYKWKYYDEKTAPDQNMLGWIAQDVQSVFPKAVKQHKFIIQEEEVDSEGNIVTPGQVIEDCLDLQSDQIIKALYGAVQKLMQKVEALESLSAA